MGKHKSAPKQSINKKSQSSAVAAVPAQIPPWPPFRPNLPIIRLEFIAPVPGFHDQITLLRNFWPKSLCRDYVTFLKGLPLTTTPGRPKRGEATRVNDRYQVSDPHFARRLWLETGLREAVLDESLNHLWGGEVVGLNPNIRIYRYSKNQFFDCHYDDANLVTLPPGTKSSTEGIQAKTTWTLLLYLTSSAEGLTGGETIFYPNDRKSPKEEIAVPPETDKVPTLTSYDPSTRDARSPLAKNGFYEPTYASARNPDESRSATLRHERFGYHTSRNGLWTSYGRDCSTRLIRSASRGILQSYISTEIFQVRVPAYCCTLSLTASAALRSGSKYHRDSQMNTWPSGSSNVYLRGLGPEVFLFVLG
ncbi:hypothetical protein F4810DRAFT_711671 [Camillea tinctor]|nr:hypothetical protein F4810DRAFT_711671 [Camillea tinctor]